MTNRKQPKPKTVYPFAHRELPTTPTIESTKTTRTALAQTGSTTVRVPHNTTLWSYNMPTVVQLLPTTTRSNGLVLGVDMIRTLIPVVILIASENLLKI